MKKILEIDTKIQEITFLFFVLSFILSGSIKEDAFEFLWIIPFVLFPVCQLMLNGIKLFDITYPKTILRLIYFFGSVHIVLSILIYFLFYRFDDFPFLGLFIWSWIILSPLLIIFSLIISYTDSREKNYKSFFHG